MKTHLLSALFCVLGLLNPSAWAFSVQVTKHGPNCWNAALVHGGVLEAIRYMSGRELHEVLRSGACSPVAEDQLRGGEIRVYSLPLARLAKTDRYVHANLRIDAEKSLNKMTSLLTARTRIEREEVVRATYGRVAEIITLHDRDGRPFHCAGDECETRVDYYRCGSLEGKLRAGDERLYSTFRRIALEIQSYVSLPVETEEADLAAVTARIAEGVRGFQEELSQSCRSAGFPCSYYREAALSFREQLHFTQPSRDWLREWQRSNPL